MSERSKDMMAASVVGVVVLTIVGTIIGGAMNARESQAEIDRGVDSMWQTAIDDLERR